MAIALDEETAAKVLRQVEFYFSDSNLPRDKFLLKCVNESEDGLVSLPLICSFTRMRSHLNIKESGPDKVPSEKTAAVAEVLRKSSALIVSEDGQKVGRSSKLLNPEEIQAAVNERTLASGPLRWNVKMDEVQSFFSEHVKVKSVRLPRHLSGQAFSGYALIELASADEAKRVQELKLEFDGVELELKTRNAFDKEMESCREEQSRSSHKQWEWKKSSGGGSGCGRDYPEGTIIAFTLKKKTETVIEPEKNEGKAATEEENMHKSEGKVATEEKVATDEKMEDNTEKAAADENNEDKSEDKNEDKDTLQVEKCTEKTEEVNASEEIEAKATNGGDIRLDREDIKNALMKFGYVKYVDYSRGLSSGFVRFESGEAAKKARVAAALAPDGGLTVKDDYIVNIEAVEGDAEATYWSTLRAGQDKKRERTDGGADRGSGGWHKGGRDKDRNGSYRGGRGGRGGRHGGRNNRDFFDTKSDSVDAKCKGQHVRFDEDSEHANERPQKISKTDHENSTPMQKGEVNNAE